jgi:hypothetical protein
MDSVVGIRDVPCSKESHVWNLWDDFGRLLYRKVSARSPSCYATY